MRTTGRIIATLASVIAMATVGAGQAQADNGLLGLLSPLLCGVQNNVNGDNNQFNQATSCQQSATTTPTPPPAGNGFSGYQVATVAISPTGTTSATAGCPAGKRVLGGGVSADPGGPAGLPWIVRESGPVLNETAWRVSVDVPANSPAVNGHVYAICADVDD